MKKCCLNCAFCMRCKKYTRFNGTQFYSDDSKELLTLSEREKAYKNDFSFLGAEKKKRQEWDDEYNRKVDALKSGALNNTVGGSRILELLTLASTAVDRFSLADKFQMPKRPDAPDEDYMSCWHDLWDFSQDDKLLNTLNDETKCLFFFPYNKKGNKSFNGCEKERVALQDKNRFTVTNTLVVAGIVVTIIAAVITYCVK